VYGVLCYEVRVGAGGIVNYEDVIHVSSVKVYVFWNPIEILRWIVPSVARIFLL
jgi:hypothetical protein